MKTYALITTMLLAAWITMECSFMFTHWDVIGIIFVTIVCSFLAGTAFLLITQPHGRKAKPRWEKVGDLEVMIQRSNNMSR